MGSQEDALAAFGVGFDTTDPSLGPRRVLAVDQVGDVAVAFVFGFEAGKGAISNDLEAGHRAGDRWRPLGGGGSWGRGHPDDWADREVVTFGTHGFAGPAPAEGDVDDDDPDAAFYWATGGFVGTRVARVLVADPDGEHDCDLRSATRAFCAAGRRRVTVTFLDADGRVLDQLDLGADDDRHRS